MENDNINQLLTENLKTLNKDDFNDQIVQTVKLHEKQKPQKIFNEKFILNWFLVTAVFVLVTYMWQHLKFDVNATLTGVIIAIAPLCLMAFNKIYTIEKL